MKKYILTFMMTMSLFASTNKLEKIVIAGPMASVTHPIFKMIEDGSLKDIAKKVEFRLWNNPDQLRAMIINKEVDFVAVPTNVAAILYNKKQDIKLLNVSIWGILQILSRDKSIKRLEDLKGKELVVPFRGDMPDIMLKMILKKKNLGKKDITIRYVTNPIDAAQMLILRRADNALLPEPATSMVLRKTGSYPLKLIAPDLYRGIDLQKEWGAVYEQEPKAPQAGMAVVGDMLQNKEAIQKFEKAYEEALAWYKAHPKEAGELVAKNIDMLGEDAVRDSISHVILEVVSASEAKKQLNFFFEVLKEDNPKIIGGKIPDDNFYIED